MDEDIDIEEHDVFDNPRIRTIFPDISQIKTEVPDFDSELDGQPGYSSQICYEDNPLEDDNCDDFNDDENYAMDYVEATATDFNPEGVYFSNKIIIGSKPNLTTEVVLPETDLYIEALNSNTYVCLEDWGNILETNPCFCKDCGTLFATINALDAHKMISHSFLVEVNEDKVIQRNYAKKSTVVHKVDGQQCSHCKLMFPNVDALTRHLYEILGVKDSNEDNDSDESNLEEQLKTAFKCPHCGCFFKDDKPLLKHLKTNHDFVESDAMKYAISAVPNSLLLKCSRCLSKTSTFKSFNAHVKVKHENLFFKKLHSDISTVGYKCLICKEVFERYTLARYHRKSMHPQMWNRPILKRVVRKSGMQPATAKAEVNSKPKLETSIKVVKKEVKQKRAARRRFDVTLYKQCRSVELSNSPVPKSVLFRCKKCNIHFISASLTMRHFPVCGKVKGKGCSKYIDCNRCNRVIRFEDRHIHDHQHNVSNKFKVYDISIRVLERTLCKCPKCDICYDDRDFWTHFENCGETEPFYCDKCDLLVSALNIEAHKFKHDNKVKDFIVIDFVSLDDAKTEVRYIQENGNVITKNKPKPKVASVKVNILHKKVNNDNVVSETENKPAKVKKSRMTLRYCDVCECSFVSIRHLKDYPKCKQLSQKVVCPHCGLYFTVSMYGKKHKKLHKQNNISLHDFKFIDFITSQKVIPKAPEYPKCSKCNVYVVNKAVSHNCRQQDVKICTECNKKFSPHAFRLHSQFHLYGKTPREKTPCEKTPRDKAPREKENEVRKDDMPVLLKKYETIKKMWNILYQCSDCKTLTDNYDHAVEHSQNHLNNIVDKKKDFVKTCKNCGLEFESKAYIRHKKLHSTTNLEINKTSFKILTYNYRNLLAGKWYKLFGDLRRENINCIISRSMYKATTNVRMKVLRIGIGSMFYQCATCKNYKDENSIYDHTHNEKCSMQDHDEKTPHIGKHSTIISFNHEFDVDFNSTLKIDKIPVIAKPVVLRFNNRIGVKKLYDVYQCDKCGISLLHKQNAVRHRCAKRSGWYCKKCDQTYLMHRKHEQHHLSLPNFNKHTINVVMFSSSDDFPDYKPKIKTKINLKFPSKIAAKIKNKVLKPAAPNLVPVTKVYKCKCGLHFTSMLTIAKHFDICPREKILSSKCSRCNLLFPTDILVSHLVKHHRDDRKIVVELVEPRKKQVKLYECARCSLLFPHKSDAIGHQDCGVNNGKRCHDCNYIFHTDSFQAHECTEYIQNDIFTVNDTDDEVAVNSILGDTTININNIDSNKGIYNKLECTVFKCTVCNIHFINIPSWFMHIESNHKMKFQSAKCDQCNLKYSSPQAMLTHQKLHHKNGNNKIHVQVMDDDAMEAVKSTKVTKFTLDDDYDHKMGKKYGVTHKMYRMMMKSHYDNSLYKCHLCPQYFVSKATWIKHAYSSTSHDGRVVKCPECDYTFMEASLLRHQFIHHYKMNLKKEELNVLDFTETKHRKHKSTNNDTVNDLSKASNNDLSMMVDSNDGIDDDDDISENVAKKTKYASNEVNCIDDENIVSSSTKDT